MTSDALQSWLAHVARERAQALGRACTDATWPDRPESLRAARLAVRRLRSVLELMGPDAPRGELKSSRRWTRELGRLRSLDVLSQLLAQSLARVGGLATQAAVEHLQETLEESRRRAQLRLARNLGARPGLPEPDEERPQPPSMKAVWDELSQLLRAALEPLKAACDAEDMEALHELRLATKRFRYALEVLGPTFPTPPTQVLTALKALQDVLGQQHDWMELEAWVGGRIQAFEARQRSALAGGLKPILVDARRERELAFGQAVALIGEVQPLELATLLRANLGVTP